MDDFIDMEALEELEESLKQKEANKTQAERLANCNSSTTRLCMQPTPSLRPPRIRRVVGLGIGGLGCVRRT